MFAPTKCNAFAIEMLGEGIVVVIDEEAGSSHRLDM